MIESRFANDINLLDLDNVSIHDAIDHKPLPDCGRASVEYVLKGIDLALDGENRRTCNIPHKQGSGYDGGFWIWGSYGVTKGENVCRKRCNVYGWERTQDLLCHYSSCYKRCVWIYNTGEAYFLLFK